MAKKRVSPPPTRSSRRWVAAGVAVLIVLIAGGIYLAMQSSAPAPASDVSVPQPDSQVLSKKVVLPALPHRPRPATLAPEQFKDPMVRKAYEVARDNPGLLEKMPCYCGCYGNSGHTNNLDCFVDKHGET